MVDDGGGGGSLVGIHNNNNIILHDDFDPKCHKTHVSRCMGCNQEIFDRYILRVAPNLEWHAACLKCNHCQQYLDETCTAFVRDGKTYCKNDYVRLFGVKCAKCDKSFSRNDYVMRARHKVFHTDCFRCVFCARQLQPGDEFALKDDQLYCREDHDLHRAVPPPPRALPAGPPPPGVAPPPPILIDPLLVGQSDLIGPPATIGLGGLTPLTGSGGGAPFSVGDPLTVLASPSTSQLQTSGSSAFAVGAKTSPTDDGGRSTSNSGAVSTSSSSLHQQQPHHHHHKKTKGSKDKQKTTRVRTVLNEKQLHTLRTCYNANPRPDALMKEQLTEMTGLSPRVIRVWFQNKRCKDKKRQNFMKHMQQQHEKNQALTGVRMQGVGPLITTSPSRHHHDMNGLPAMMQPLDIQQFQQNPSIWGPPPPDGVGPPPLPLPPSHPGALHHGMPTMSTAGGIGVTPFQQLIQGFGDGSDPTLCHWGGGLASSSGGGVRGGGAYGGATSTPYDDDHLDHSFSPQMGGAHSDLSSPSGSD